MKILFLVLLAFLSCNNKHEVIIEFNNQKKPIFKNIHLEKKFPRQALEILENSLDDSCKIGLMVVAPKKTGKIYDVEFYDSLLRYTYFPFKASKGTLKIKHTFY
jgi:hypothetical protein